MTNVTVCADDFGLTSGISSGILACLERRRISATSCMTARAAWMDRAAELRPFVEIADIGLHFTLTDLEPVGAASILAPHGRLRRSLTCCGCHWPGVCRTTKSGSSLLANSMRSSGNLARRRRILTVTITSTSYRACGRSSLKCYGTAIRRIHPTSESVTM
jgi:YdjC-like protein